MLVSYHFEEHVWGRGEKCNKKTLGGHLRDKTEAQPTFKAIQLSVTLTFCVSSLSFIREHGILK